MACCVSYKPTEAGAKGPKEADGTVVSQERSGGQAGPGMSTGCGELPCVRVCLESRVLLSSQKDGPSVLCCPTVPAGPTLPSPPCYLWFLASCSPPLS